jgi:hypothetical protein
MRLIALIVILAAALSSEARSQAGPVKVPVLCAATSHEPISLQGIEVTQAIQDMNNSVQLIAGKPTWVRVYLHKNGCGRAITAKLEADRSDIGVTTISPARSIIVDAGDLRTRRMNLAKSLNFYLPAPVTASGTVTFRLVAVTNAGFGPPSVSCANCANTTQVTFLNAPPLIVSAVGMTYTFVPAGSPQGSPPLTGAPGAIDFALLKSWLARAYPVSSVVFTEGTIASTSLSPPFPPPPQGQDLVPCTNANAELAALWATDVLAGSVDPRTHYYGLVSDRGGFMRGCANPMLLPGGLIASAPNPTSVASGPTGPNWPGDSDGSFGDWYGGHELAHTFGRRHPGFCGTPTPQAADDPDPLSRLYPNGQIGDGTDSGYVGLDVGDSSRSIPMMVLWPTSTFDIMTYCAQPQWLSAYTYEGVRQQLLAENPGFRTLALRVAEAQTFLTGPMVHVAAIVNLTRGTGEFKYVTPVERGSAQVGPTDRAALVVRDGSGEQLSLTSVALRETTDVPVGQDQTALVAAAVPFSRAMAQIDLMLDGRILAQYRSATTEPVPPQQLRLGATMPATPAAASVGPTLSWAPSADASSTISYTVQISDDGTAWRTIAIGLKRPSVTLSTDQARARIVRVIASNGFRSSTPAVIRLGQ